jgi:hypothetical protein
LPVRESHLYLVARSKCIGEREAGPPVGGECDLVALSVEADAGSQSAARDEIDPGEGETDWWAASRL